jgi:hypothetical protein
VTEDAFIVLAGLAMVAASAAIWLGLARFLHLSLPQRGWAAVCLPALLMALFLGAQGSPFNGVIAIVLLPPATLACAAAVLMLERFADGDAL